MHQVPGFVSVVRWKEKDHPGCTPSGRHCGDPLRLELATRIILYKVNILAVFE